MMISINDRPQTTKRMSRLLGLVGPSDKRLIEGKESP